jgi:hypothetical protein
MFSMITNIYNKKTKGPALMELFTATGKRKKFFFFFVRCVHHGWHGTHRYDIQVLATHASTDVDAWRVGSRYTDYANRLPSKLCSFHKYV